MNPKIEALKTNLFTSKQDYLLAVETMGQVAVDTLNPELPGLLNIGSTGTTYNHNTIQAEGFLRLFWGYAGYYAHHEVDATFDRLLAGVIDGVNPQSKGYWGKISGTDQLMVEMAPLSVFLILNQDKVWPRLYEAAKRNLFTWLDQINHFEPVKNNWLFFRVLVNVCFDLCYGYDNRAQIDVDLDYCNGFYMADGWYHDGNVNQIDYYISFAIHYYSLIYAKLYAKQDPERSQLFKERAALFAQEFRYWFDGQGRGVPFGRSLTYRFAQSSFWSAMLFAEVDDFPLAETKAHLQENLHFWMQQAIFSETGLLKIGYAYEHLTMSEEYNGSGSPYWAFKAFIVLGLPNDHSIWTLAPKIEAPYDQQKRLNSPHMLVAREPKTGQELQIFPTGQYCEKHCHGEAKYSKFVYSTNFGFNVPKGIFGLERGAFDSTLAVSEQDDYFRVRTQCETFEVTDVYTQAVWQPWADVRIISTIVPLYPFHIRIHHVISERNLRLSDGGFSVPFTQEASIQTLNQTETQAFIGTSKLVSGIVGTDSQQNAVISGHLPNVNVCHNTVAFPYLLTDLAAGQHTLISIVYGNCSAELPTDLPVVTYENGQVTIVLQDKQLTFKL